MDMLKSLTAISVVVFIFWTGGPSMISPGQSASLSAGTSLPPCTESDVQQRRCPHSGEQCTLNHNRIMLSGVKLSVAVTNKESACASTFGQEDCEVAWSAIDWVTAPTGCVELIANPND